MGRTFKKQPQENKPRKIKNGNEKSSTKRQKHYDLNDDELMNAEIN